MDNITKINLCITMLERIKRLSADVDNNQYSKDIDKILRDIDYLDTDMSYDYILQASSSVPTQATEAYWKSVEAKIGLY